MPRERFVPVKTTNDLLVLRSDVYALDDDARVRARAEAPFVNLAPGPYKLVRDFDARFPAGPPSLERCTRLEVAGDWTFGSGVVCTGDVALGDEGGRIDDGVQLGK